MKLGAAGAVIAAGAGGWWSWHRGVFVTEGGEPYDAWRTWREGEKNQRLVRAAILAASKHNTQPWEFRVEPSYIDVFVHPERNTGALDPFRQESYMSSGCAIANLLAAASAEGYATRVEYTPEPELESWVAKVELAPATPVVSDLYRAIPRRHTNRGAYLSKVVSDQAMADMRRVSQGDDGIVDVTWLNESAERKKFSDLTLAATRAIMNDPDQEADGARWYRASWPEVVQAQDGMTLDASGAPLTRRLTQKLFVSPGPRQWDEKWLERTDKVQLATAPLFGILTIADPNDRAQVVKAGVAWERIHLWATANGLAAQPLTQSLERASREKATGAPNGQFVTAIRTLAGSEGCREPIFAFRIGYPAERPTASPRRPVELVIAKKSAPPRPAEKA